MAKHTIDIDVNCKSASVYPNGNNAVTVTLDTLDLGDLISSVDLNTIIEIIGPETILDGIDKDTAIKFYDITEAEPE